MTYFFSPSAVAGSVAQKDNHEVEIQTSQDLTDSAPSSSSSNTLTFDLQLAADGCLSVVVHGFAGVHAAVEVTRPADLQRADTLNADLPVLGVVSNNHLVLHPLNLGLRRGEEKKSCQLFRKLATHSNNHKSTSGSDVSIYVWRYLARKVGGGLFD